jgi:hypothetical protein
MTQREPEFGAELDAAEVAPLAGPGLGGPGCPALPPQVVSTGAPFAIVVLRRSGGVGAAQSESGCGDGVAARARSGGSMSSPRISTKTRPSTANDQVAGEDAVLWRRRSGHGFGGRLRHQLPGGSRRGAFGQRACTCARAWRWAAERSFSFRKKRCSRGSRMCAWRAALFLWQKDSFSCRDAHAFNRNSSSQVHCVWL